MRVATSDLAKQQEQPARLGTVATRHRRGSVLTLCLVQFVDVLGVTVVVTALPSMLSDLGASAADAIPVVTGYAMFFGGLLMLGARLGDRYGHRRVLLGGVLLFAAGSLLAAVATSLPWLVAGRCVQGVAAAGSVPTALRLLTVGAEDEERRRRALAMWSASGAVAGASGLLLGGVITQAAGWRLIFWLNLPLAAGLVAAVMRTVPPTVPVPRLRLDLPGAAALTTSVMGLVLGCSLLERADLRAVGVALLAAGVGLLVVFAMVEAHSTAPLLPRAAVRKPRLRLGAVGSFANTATTSSVITLATLYLQDTRGAGPALAGLALLPFSLAVVVASAATAPSLMRRVGPRLALASGLGIVAAGDLVLLAVPAAVALLPVGVGIAGYGLGLSAVAATTIGTDVPESLAGTAAGLLNTTAQLGTALGVAAVVLVATTTGGWVVGSWQLGWLVAAAAAALAGLVIAGRRPAPARDVPEGARQWSSTSA
jgi:MFS family permease